MKKQVNISDYREIANRLHEEDPIWQCKNCFRETNYGKESIRWGEISGQLINQTCIYCNEKLVKITGNHIK